MAPPKGHRWYGGGMPKITENTPLKPDEWKFVLAYTRCETAKKGLLGKTASSKIRASEKAYGNWAYKMLKRPNVKKKIEEIMQEQIKKTIADSNEVMEYFTAVMRGEIKDQFGLDAPLVERTSAAKELAKRTTDVELRKQGLADNQVNININWGDAFTLPDITQPQESVGISLFSDESEEEDED